MKRLLLGLVLLGACNQSEPPPIADAIEADSADQVAYKFETEATNGGVLLSRIRGDSAWYYQSSQTWVLKGMTIIFPDSTGRTTSTITAKSGTFKTTDQSLVARDSVVGTTPKGQVLKTDHLVWDKVANEISSDTFFVLTSPTEPTRMSGSRFVATPDFQSVRISKPKGIVNGAKPAPVKKPVPKKAGSGGMGNK